MKNYWVLTLSLMLLLLLLLVQPLVADTLTLKNGNILEGKIVQETAQEITIEVAFGKMIIARREIARIKRRSSADNIITQGDRLLSLGAVEHALKFFEKAAAENPENQELQLAAGNAYRYAARHYLKNLQISLARQATQSALRYDANVSLDDIPAEIQKYENWARQKKADGDSLLLRRDPFKAMEAYYAALAVFPEWEAEMAVGLAEAAMLAGDVHYQQKQFDKAAMYYELGLKTKPEFVPFVEERWLAAQLNLVSQTAIANQQWTEAQETLTKILQIFPTCRPALYLSGMVAEQQQNLGLAFECYQKVLNKSQSWSGDLQELADSRKLAQTASGVVIIEKHGEEVTHEDTKAAAQGFFELQTEHFQIFHHNEQLAMRIADTLESHWKLIQTRLAPADWQANWPKPCQVYVYASKDEYQQKSGSAAWTEGVTQMRFRPGRLSQHAIHVYQGAHLLFSSILPHELTHVLAPWFIHYQHQLPVWLNEGMAMSSEAPFHQNYRLRLLYAKMRQNRLYPLDTLFSLRQYPEDKDLFYSQSFAVVNFLLKKYGTKAWWDFVHQTVRSSPSQALQQVYGYSSLEEFESQWRGSIMGNK